MREIEQVFAKSSEVGNHIRNSVSLAAIRANGGVSARFAIRAGSTRAVETREADGYKLRVSKAAVARPEASIINTGGGVAGGDRVTMSVEMLNDAAACVTSPAAERIYRAANDQPASINVDLRLGANAHLEWLPQETIVFDQARLRRRINVEMPSSATLVLAETLVFGRKAMGEQLRTGAISDRWNVRRDGALVYAEAIRLDGDIARMLNSSAGAGGGCAVATILTIGPGAEDRRDTISNAIGAHRDVAAASAWNGMMVLRVVSQDLRDVRTILSSTLPLLTGNPLPRVWAN